MQERAASRGLVIMARDASKYVRQAILAYLKTKPSVTALIPADRLYPGQLPASPVWPYGYTGVPVSTPNRASCMDGSIISMVFHSWARTTTADGAGENKANDIGDVIATTLDGVELDLPSPYPAKAYINWVSNQTIRDADESSAFHNLCALEITIVS